MNTEPAEMPAISVIIPAFNEAGYISETLKCLSAAEQHFKGVAAGDIEILVVDNASTDSTAELARSAGAIVVYEAEHNIAKVRNVGAAAARYDVLVFLDADTLMPPELLLRIARAWRLSLLHNEGRGAFFGRSRFRGPADAARGMGLLSGRRQ